MKRPQLRFAGPNTHEVLTPGRHTTLRPATGWAEFENEYVQIIDLEHKLMGIALIKEVAGPIEWESIGRLGDIKGERTPYNTGPKLQAGLLRFYGESAAAMDYEAISFITFLAEVGV